MLREEEGGEKRSDVKRREVSQVDQSRGGTLVSNSRFLPALVVNVFFSYSGLDLVSGMCPLFYTFGFLLLVLISKPDS